MAGISFSNSSSAVNAMSRALAVARCRKCANAIKSMPVILTMGENDQRIPVAETRKIAAAMKGQANVVYHEIPQGDQDAALWVDVDLEKLSIRKAKSSTPPAGD